LGKKYAHKLLNAAEVAEILRISRSKVYRLMKTGDLPSVRMDKSVRVRKMDLEEFIKTSIYYG
jgi:excisionase family DNA binding protein